MPKPQRVTIAENLVSSGKPWRQTWLGTAVVMVALTLSGCRTTSEYTGEHLGGHFERTGASAMTAAASDGSIGDGITVARLQSPAAGPSTETAMPRQPPGLPPLPDPGLPSTASEPDQLPLALPPADGTAAITAPSAGAVLVPAADGAAARDSPAIQGLSSIARNRLRILANPQRPVSTPDGAIGGLPAGSTATGTSSPRQSGMSSILRNRVGAETAAGEVPQFDFPDLRANPADIYRDRFGLVEEEPDRFLFPWLVNLIYEDRWLLDESDPARALQNQLRRRLKVDIRDPDPDTANFPNGAYTIPKGRLYIENSPVGFYGASKGTPATYQWETLMRYGLTDNLEFRIFTNGFTAQARQGKRAATTRILTAGVRLQGEFLGRKHEVPSSRNGHRDLPAVHLRFPRVQPRDAALDEPPFRSDAAAGDQLQRVQRRDHRRPRTRRARSSISSVTSGRFSARW